MGNQKVILPLQPQPFYPANGFVLVPLHHSCRGIRVAIDFTTKMNGRSIAIMIAALASSNVAGFAQEWTQNLYAHFGAGYLYQQDTTLSMKRGPSLTTGNATFNPGIRGNVALGYNLNKSWAAEFDTGVLWNSMDKFGGVALSASGQTFNTYTVPFLANVIYRVPFKGRWSAYVGAGAGGAATILAYTQSPYDPGDYNFVFAYQAEAGLKYTLSQNASFGVAYEFLGTTDPSWHTTVKYSPLIPPTETYFQEKGFYTHSLVLTFTWTF